MFLDKRIERFTSSCTESGIKDGKRKKEKGKRKKEKGNGKWEMGNGKWEMGNGK